MSGDGEGFGRASRLSTALVMGFCLLIEGLLQAMNALPVVARSSLATTGDAESTAQAGVVPEPGEERSEVVAIFKKKPVRPWSMRDLKPPTRLAMTGLPALQASRTTMPKGSCMEGRTKTSQAW